MDDDFNNVQISPSKDLVSTRKYQFEQSRTPNIQIDLEVHPTNHETRNSKELSKHSQLGNDDQTTLGTVGKNHKRSSGQPMSSIPPTHTNQPTSLDPPKSLKTNENRARTGSQDHTKNNGSSQELIPESDQSQAIGRKKPVTSNFPSQKPSSESLSSPDIVNSVKASGNTLSDYRKSAHSCQGYNDVSFNLNSSSNKPLQKTTLQPPPEANKYVKNDMELRPKVSQNVAAASASSSSITKIPTSNESKIYPDIHHHHTSQKIPNNLLNNPSKQKTEKGIIPEISRITPDLDKVLRDEPQCHIAVFYHKSNVTKDDTIASFIHHHDAKWKDRTYIRTVFSTKNNIANHEGQFKKWDAIKRSLISLVEKCTSGKQFKRIDSLMRSTLLAYDENVDDKTDFQSLNHPDIVQIFPTTIPLIVQHSLRLPSLLAEPIPLLKANQNKTIYLTKKLICSLLANSFFCTIPQENENMPDINFHNMFHSAMRGDAKIEKLKCILNYFQQMGKPGQSAEKENQIISFERRCIPNKLEWTTSTKSLVKVEVEPLKKIEEAHGSLQVDFANKKVGGGVLNEGAVMEEILFAICPELIVSRLFTENLEDDEALVITGSEQFSKYIGYSRNFRYNGSSKPINYKMDKFGRNCSQVVVMDALHFRQHEFNAQFQRNYIDRELHKAYVGFFLPMNESNTPVATGNWGCGAFNGDLELKFLIQWMAASEAGRNLMIYHTIGDQNQSYAIESMYKFLKEKNVSVGKLYKRVIGYERKMQRYSSIFDYIRNSKTLLH